tara:strand:- start:29 stop:409 length:381 start_codon:yes stop_codon:yes gene_type:complete
MLSKFLIFCIVGGFTFIIDLILVNLLFFLGLPFPIARTLSISLALVFNFFANRGITFGANRRAIKKQVIPYAVVYITSNLINLFSSILIVHIAGESFFIINIASFIGIIISVPISFLGSLLWTFKK